jgi:hypothetical protein
MPTIARRGPFRVFFYSADCGEPAHVHVERDVRVAKVWLHDLTIARSGGFPAPELGRIMQMVRDGRSEFQEVWNEHCGG